MPLPDERRGRGVADLIGRFEIKRGAPGDAPPVPRPPIQIPGRVPSGVQERKANLGPEFADSVARSASYTRSREVSESTPITNFLKPGEDVPEPVMTSKQEIHTDDPTISEIPTVSAPIPQVDELTASKITTPPSTTKYPHQSPPTRSPPRVLASAPAKSRSPQPTTSRLSAEATKKVQNEPTRHSKATLEKRAPSNTPIHTRVPSGSANAASPPHYMTPLRPQPTGGSTRSISMSTPRGTTPVSLSKRRPSGGGGSSALMAPTASSLAKAKPPVSSTRGTTTTPVKKPTVPAVPFPSVRKPKPTSTSAVPAKNPDVSPVKAATAGSTPSRKARMSQSSSGPSAAALAARAKLAAGVAPPVPQIPVGVTSDTSPIPASAAPDPEPVFTGATIVESLGDGSGAVLVVDGVDGGVIAPPARPLTEAALENHDEKLVSEPADQSPVVLGDGILVPQVPINTREDTNSNVALHDGKGKQDEPSSELSSETGDVPVDATHKQNLQAPQSDDAHFSLVHNAPQPQEDDDMPLSGVPIGKGDVRDDHDDMKAHGGVLPHSKRDGEALMTGEIPDEE